MCLFCSFFSPCFSLRRSESLPLSHPLIFLFPRRPSLHLLLPLFFSSHFSFNARRAGRGADFSRSGVGGSPRLLPEKPKCAVGPPGRSRGFLERQPSRAAPLSPGGSGGINPLPVAQFCPQPRSGCLRLARSVGSAFSVRAMYGDGVCDHYPISSYQPGYPVAMA